MPKLFEYPYNISPYIVLTLNYHSRCAHVGFIYFVTFFWGISRQRTVNVILVEMRRKDTIVF